MVRPSARRDDGAAPRAREGRSRLGAYMAVRAATERLVEPLSPEDCVVQSMPDVSPTKWHLAHTSWFFETFLLKVHARGYRSAPAIFEHLFNSYYVRLGSPYLRAARGLLTRPSLAEIRAYRRRVDDGMRAWLERGGGASPEATRAFEVGLHHEMQHQELILMDIKHVLSCNPIAPGYRDGGPRAGRASAPAQAWVAHPGGIVEIGQDDGTFAFDNERPRHRVLLEPFALASRPVTNGEYLAFIEAGGYTNPEWWLSEGWDQVRAAGRDAPLYWRREDAAAGNGRARAARRPAWREFTLKGLQALDPAQPVCHVSYFEANAYAAWAGARLPSEFEWEAMAAERPPDGTLDGNTMESGRLHPAPAKGGAGLQQMYGDVWEWTQSAYAPYPGFQAETGDLGEYNGKFMVNQYVLRGGSCATPRGDVRATYRNFFPASARWPFTGIRLAR